MLLFHATVHYIYVYPAIFKYWEEEGGLPQSSFTICSCFIGHLYKMSSSIFLYSVVCIDNTLSSGHSYLYNGFYIYTNRTQDSTTNTIAQSFIESFKKIDVNCSVSWKYFTDCLWSKFYYQLSCCWYWQGCCRGAM